MVFREPLPSSRFWVAVEDLNFNYHNPDTILVTRCYYVSILWKFKSSFGTATQDSAHGDLGICQPSAGLRKPWAPWPAI